MGIPHRIQPARGSSTAEDRLRLLNDTVPTLVWTSLPDTFSYSLRDELDSASAAQVRLMGFGIAWLRPRERQAPEPPESIAGTLAYMAPKQTGRMNRSIDSRSDLYALGVTLYEMLTGTLPFIASDETGALPYREAADTPIPLAMGRFARSCKLRTVCNG